jgi:hypothetical protein
MARRQRITSASPGYPVVVRKHPHEIPAPEEYPFGNGGVYEIGGDELTFGKDPGRISRFKEPKRDKNGKS